METFSPRENPARAIYGVVVIGALMAAESGHHESYLDALLSAAIAASIYWLAHAYAEVLARRLRTRRRLSPGALREALAHERALLAGAALPMAALAVAGLSGADAETAVTAALWTSVAALAVLEGVAGVRAGASRGELAIEVAVGLALGVAIIALKIILH